MEDLLKEKLWDYIGENNPDLMYILQEEYGVGDYLNKKIEDIRSALDAMHSESMPQYIIEEVCLEMLTEELKPSRFIYVRTLLLDEFEETYDAFDHSGILTCEVINLMESCSPVFENFGFTIENQESPALRNAVIGQIADYLNGVLD